ncbi:MAG TPA: ABC transporter permease [Candidatus Paceibacterota bacterium]|nr:ABC transporter permease [Verrucomicrobiota bacterium]HRY48106.1 ABC transporter permease [Candidatus Paceibacterota bacterium]HSA00643.1 ABC transporter permease [Candidatus Paceibacterota bacterium]
MNGRRLLLMLLNQVSWLLFASVLIVFGILSPRFLDGANLVNILIQSSSLAIVATGMTFVLLTAGVDLSVGAIMFVAAAFAGKLMLAGFSLSTALIGMMSVGLVFGAVNGFLVTRLRIVAFIVTLAMLYLGRGLGLWITQTRAMNLPESFLHLGSSRILGVPIPLLLFTGTVAVAHWILARTPFGRQLYAIGQDAEAARKAGVHTRLWLFSVYVISGLCAALGGIVSLAQLGAVSPTFGQQREFSAIAAAVLGGTSLFGGRGKVFPGTVLGAVLIQMVENGLVILNANPYLYPLITSAIIFMAVLIDCARYELMARMNRRRIR